MNISNSISKYNYNSFLFHAAFLAFAQSFIDIDTIVPSMMVEVGGNALHIGIMTTIMFGGSSFTQLFFAPVISNYPFKKWSLLLGINSRIFSLMGLGVLLIFISQLPGVYAIWLILLLLTLFSLGGAFANISYTDILGKSIISTSRKKFFSIKQVIAGILLLVSSFIARQVLISSAYPKNYSIMYLIAFASLFIASLGFWRIKENIPSQLKIRGISDFTGKIREELKNNIRLKYFLGFINTMGISLTILPFIILYAKTAHGVKTTDVGTFLILKILGSVLMGFLLYKLSKIFKYKYLLYINLVFVILLPLLILTFTSTPPFFIIFFLGGVIYSIYSVTMNGILLEISNSSNRAIYTGMAGAGNIIPAIFPLIGSALITNYGLQYFLIVYIAVILLSLFFINKLDCKS